MKSGGEWQTEIINLEDYISVNPSLALDSGGNPHISYVDLTINRLKHAWKSDEGWQTEIVDQDSDVMYDSSLALDSGGNPHISYVIWDETVYKLVLKHAWKMSGEGWQTETVDQEGFGSSLALDSNGNPRISYGSGGGGAPAPVMVAGTETIENGDGEGEPYLKYAWKNGGGWHTEIVDVGPFGYTSLALDSGGNPHISYVDWDHWDLKYAYQSSVDLSNMQISKNAPVSMDRGNVMVYTLYYYNSGNILAENVWLQDTLPPEVVFVSASDGGTSESGKVTWNLGSVDILKEGGRGTRTVTVSIPETLAIGTNIQNTASISTTTPESNYGDNTATATTGVTGTNLPPNVGVSPILGGSGGTPIVYWNTLITFSYDSSCATGIGIRIHFDDGLPDITGEMTESPPDTWTYTTSFYPRHGEATVTYTVTGCDPSEISFNLYVDPAGYVYDVITGDRIEGATVYLQRPDGTGGWENVPVGESPPVMVPDTNPLTTNSVGQYQWDVLAGTYRVHVEAPGYEPADSIAVNVPPPVTDLHVGLTPILVPAVPEFPSVLLPAAFITVFLGAVLCLRRTRGN